jgi:hypothetical protein
MSPHFEIDFSPRRDQRRDDLWIDHEVEHGEIPPVGGKKRTHANKICGDQGAAPTESVQQLLERGVRIGPERSGHGIVALGLFFRRWQRGRVNDSEIKMRVSVVWIF